MKNVLQLLTGAKPELAEEAAKELQPEIVDLTREDLNYRDVLEKIFAADSIQVW